MKIGIIGSGHIGGNLGIHLASAGHRVLFSSRHPEELKDLAKEAGQNAKIGTVTEAAEFGDVIILSVPYWAVEEVAEKTGALGEKVIIDTTNPYPERDGQFAAMVRRSERAASEFVADAFPGARLVKAFNTIYYEHLKNQADREGERRAIPYAGDHESSLNLVARLIDEIGFEPVCVGTLSESHPMDVGGVLYNRDMTAEEVKENLKGENKD